MQNIINSLIEPFSHDFFIRAIVAATFVLIANAILGFGTITKRYAYFGHGISQSMLGGIALGSVVGINNIISAFSSAILASILILSLIKKVGLTSDSAIAIVSSAGMSLGVALISLNRDRPFNVSNILFGNILGVTWSEVIILALMALIAVLFISLNGRRLALSAISPDVATAHGVNVSKIEMQRIILTALVTSASVQVVGVTLVVAALILPAVTASLITRNLGATHIIAVVIGIVTSLVGLLLSYWINIPSGPAVVITSIVLYLLVFCYSKISK